MASLYRAGRFGGDEAAVLLGRSILVLIGLELVTGFLVRLVWRPCVDDVYPATDMPEDERDRLIELKSAQIALAVFVLGFFGAMVALALGFAPVGTIFLILVVLFLASVADDIAKIAFYRRGLAV